MTLRATIKGYILVNSSQYKEIFLQTYTQRRVKYKEMAREWKELIDRGGENGFGGNVFVVLWLSLTTIVLISIIVFSCADGAVPRNKDDAAESSVYVGAPTSGCATACGAACGA